MNVFVTKIVIFYYEDFESLSSVVMILVSDIVKTIFAFLLLHMNPFTCIVCVNNIYLTQHPDDSSFPL